MRSPYVLNKLGIDITRVPQIIGKPDWINKNVRLQLLTVIIMHNQNYFSLLRILFEILRLFKYFLVNIINGYWWIVELIK